MIIVARRVGEAPDPYGEHCTTYGQTVEHCAVAARIGDHLKHRVIGWPDTISLEDLRRLADHLHAASVDARDDTLAKRDARPRSVLIEGEIGLVAFAAALAPRIGIVTLPERGR